MKTRFIISLICFFSCAFIMNAQQRIIGGQTIDISQAPYQVGIFAKKSDGTHFGGGFLLNNQWILTAKHVVDGSSVSGIEISLGHNNPMSESTNPNADNDHKSISQIIKHSSADIALVKLSTPVSFTDKIAPVHISNTKSYVLNTVGTVTGWGKTSLNGGAPHNQLQRCSVTIQSCTDERITASPTNGSPLEGDSGGALVIEHSGYVEAIGVCSEREEYDPTSAQFFVNIGNYYNWISSYVNLYSISGPSVMSNTGTFSYSAPGCTVSVSSNLEIVSQSGSSMLVKYLSAGLGSISIKAGSRTIYQNEFWAGTPVITRIDGPTRTPNTGYATFRAIYDARCNPTKFEWKVNPTPGAMFGANSDVLDVAFYQTGSYQVVVRAQNAAGMGEYRTSGCNVYSASRSLTVYPNPATCILNIKFDDSGKTVNTVNGKPLYDIKLYNIHGSLKLSTKSSGEQVSLDVSGLSEGNYILQISDGVEISVEQIIIKR